MLLNVVTAPTTFDAPIDTQVARSKGNLKREKRKWSVKKKKHIHGQTNGHYTAVQPAAKRQHMDAAAQDTTQQLKGYSLDDAASPRRRRDSDAVVTMDDSGSDDDALDSEQEEDVLAAVQAVMRRERSQGCKGGRPTNQVPVGVDYHSSSDEDKDNGPRRAAIGNTPHNNSTPSAARAVAALAAAPAPAVAAANAAAARRLANKQAKKLAKQQQRGSKQPGMVMPHMRDLVHVGGAMHGTVDVEDNERAGSVPVSNKAAHSTDEAVANTASVSPNDDRHTSDTNTFEGIGISVALASHLEECNFTRPSVIQTTAIPAVLTGRDVLINAATGSGKTLCYLAPIIDRLAAVHPRVSRQDGTQCLIIAPTRELVLQIQAVMALLLRRFAFLVGGVLLGGENRNHEKRRLRKGIGLLVATPGRLLDHLQSTGSFRIDQLRWLVLDEADRLLDMGFRERLGQIISSIDTRAAATNTHRRQTVLLSATLGQDVLSLASLSLKEPLQVGLGAGDKVGAGVQNDGAQATPTYTLPVGLQQSYVEAPCKLRLVTLAALLARCAAAAPRNAKVVVFVSACDCVEFTHRLLGDALGDLPGCATLFKLHGLLSQAERTASFVAFNKAPRGVLLCTDVAARGLDFPSVTHIIQYDPPGAPAEYVHRVGRTARAGAQGHAMVLLQPHEMGYLSALQGAGVGPLEPMHLESLLDGLVSRGGKQGSLVRGRSLESHEGAYRLQMRVLEAVQGDPGLKRVAVDAFRSFVRAYATHPLSVRHIFDIKQLHLGHVAHAFGLKDPPGLLGTSSTKKKIKTQRKQAAKHR